MYVCRKMNNSQARTGHQRGMDGRETDDDVDDTPSDTQTQTSSHDTQPAGLPHTLSGRTHNSRPRSPCRPPQHPRCQGLKQHQTNTDKRQGLTREAEGLLRLSSDLAGRDARTRPCVGSCEASMDALLSGYPPAASPNSHSSG